MDLHLFARTEAGLEGTDESDRAPSSRAGPVCRNASHRDFVARLRWVRASCAVT